MWMSHYNVVRTDDPRLTVDDDHVVHADKCIPKATAAESVGRRAIALVHASDTLLWGGDRDWIRVDAVRQHYMEAVAVLPFSESPNDWIAANGESVCGWPTVMRLADELALGRDFRTEREVLEWLWPALSNGVERRALAILCQGFLVAYACAAGGDHLNVSALRAAAGSGDAVSSSLEHMGWPEVLTRGLIDYAALATQYDRVDSTHPAVTAPEWWRTALFGEEVVDLGSWVKLQDVHSLVVAIVEGQEISPNLVAAAYLQLCDSV